MCVGGGGYLIIFFLFGCSKKNICQTVVKEIRAFGTGNLPLLYLSSNSVARIPDRPFIALVQ